MQLLFTLDELQILADLLEQRSEAGADPPACLSALDAILDKVIARRLQFSADELDLLSEVVHEALSRPDKSRRAVLERISDKLTEACAMA